MPVPPALISVLARSLMSGEQNAGSARDRAERTLGRPWKWLVPLASRYIQAFASEPCPRHRDVVRFLQRDPGLRRAGARYGKRLSIAEWMAEPPRMRSVDPFRQWNLPAIESVGDLADWLSLTPNELDWFADLKGLTTQAGSAKLQHYRYTVSPKRRGGIRLIESPKPRLKEVQRQILSRILNLIPPHPAAHGFVKGRSIVSFAGPHCNKAVLLRLDLKDFFPASPAVRVQALFRTLGYPETVANRLGGLCTNSVQAPVWSGQQVDRELQSLYARPHLPQGAPTSPSLASLMAYRFDCRLTGLARSAGAAYTRYADDLAFSGGEEFSRVAGRFSLHAAAIALDEGFSVNHRKTRIMRQGVRQQLAGLVVNSRPALRRRDLELLEAILTNCVRHGPASQNRSGHPDFRAHLQGRVSFVEMVNTSQGAYLRELLERIEW